MAEELKKSWNDANGKKLEHAKNLILGDVDLDDNSISDDEEREPLGLENVYQEKKTTFLLIQKEHFLLLSAPITKKKNVAKRQREICENFNMNSSAKHLHSYNMNQATLK